MDNNYTVFSAHTHRSGPISVGGTDRGGARDQFGTYKMPMN